MSALLTYFGLVVNRKKRYHDGNWPLPPPERCSCGAVETIPRVPSRRKSPRILRISGQERTPQGRQYPWPCPSTNVLTSSGSTASLYPPPTARSASLLTACITRAPCLKANEPMGA